MRERLERVVGGVLRRVLSLEREGGAALRDLGLGSLRMIQLIGDLEREFGIRIDDSEVDPDNFETLQVLHDFIARKLPPT